MGATAPAGNSTAQQTAQAQQEAGNGAAISGQVADALQGLSVQDGAHQQDAGTMVHSGRGGCLDSWTDSVTRGTDKLEADMAGAHRLQSDLGPPCLQCKSQA